MKLDERDLAFIYETATDGQAWPRLLERLADRIRAEASCLTVRDLVEGTIAGTYIRGDASTFAQYLGYPFDLNPLKTVASAPVGTFLPDYRQVRKEEFVRTGYYRDFIEPNGIHAFISGTLWRDDERRCVINFSRSRTAGEFGTDEIEWMQAAAPHLVRTMGIALKLGRAELQSRGAEAALDALPHGLILLDETCRIRHANRAAHAIAAARDGLEFSRTGLRGARPSDTARLAAALAKARQPSGTGSALRLERPSGARAYTVLVTPVQRESDWLGTGVTRILVAVTDPERLHVPPEARLAQLYGLTRAESRVAVGLLTGLEIAEIADQAGIAVSTARLHLHRILTKTGATRQADLVRLLLQESTVLR